jgi:hypothetical protein
MKGNKSKVAFWVCIVATTAALSACSRNDSSNNNPVWGRGSGYANQGQAQGFAATLTPAGPNFQQLMQALYNADGQHPLPGNIQSVSISISQIYPDQSGNLMVNVMPPPIIKFIIRTDSGCGGGCNLVIPATSGYATQQGVNVVYSDQVSQVTLQANYNMSGAGMTGGLMFQGQTLGAFGF